MGAFASWREVVQWSVRNPAHLCKQRVAGNGEPQRTFSDLATTGVDGKRYYDHATSSNAYIHAVREERTRRVRLTLSGTSWSVYTYVIFEDAAAEDDGESFMMWHAVSAHIPLEDQCKPDNWFVLGVANKLKFATHRIACAPLQHHRLPTTPTH